MDFLGLTRAPASFGARGSRRLRRIEVELVVAALLHHMAFPLARDAFQCGFVAAGDRP